MLFVRRFGYSETFADLGGDGLGRASFCQVIGTFVASGSRVGFDPVNGERGMLAVLVNGSKSAKALLGSDQVGLKGLNG